MSKEVVKHGRPWNIVAKFASYEEADAKRKELLKTKGAYVVDMSKEKKVAKKKISRDNKSIKNLARKMNIKGDYVGFANKVIGGWESLDSEEKSKYNSFEDWVNKTLMTEKAKQEISIAR